MINTTLVDQILQCSRIAAVKVEEITEIIQYELKRSADANRYDCLAYLLTNVRNRSSISEGKKKLSSVNKPKVAPPTQMGTVKPYCF